MVQDAAGEQSIDASRVRLAFLVFLSLTQLRLRKGTLTTSGEICKGVLAVPGAGQWP